jgi:predicted nucleic acid-binding protein
MAEGWVGRESMSGMRIYTDTSVIGGCFDDEFAEDSRRLFDLARSGRLSVLISQVVVEELADAPKAAQEVLRSSPRKPSRSCP